MRDGPVKPDYEVRVRLLEAMQPCGCAGAHGERCGEPSQAGISRKDKRGIWYTLAYCSRHMAKYVREHPGVVEP